MPTVARSSTATHINAPIAFYKNLIRREGVDVGALQSADEVAEIAISDPNLRLIATEASDEQGISRHTFYRQVRDFIRRNNDIVDSMGSRYVSITIVPGYLSNSYGGLSVGMGVGSVGTSEQTLLARSSGLVE